MSAVPKVVVRRKQFWTQYKCLHYDYYYYYFKSSKKNTVFATRK